MSFWKMLMPHFVMPRWKHVCGVKELEAMCMLKAGHVLLRTLAREVCKKNHLTSSSRKRKQN
jgi:hypothetical protein